MGNPISDDSIIDLTVDSDNNEADEDEIESVSDLPEESPEESSDEMIPNGFDRRVGKPPIILSDDDMEVDLSDDDGPDDEKSGGRSEIDLDDVYDTGIKDQRLETALGSGSESDETESLTSDGSHTSRIVENVWSDMDFLSGPVGTSKEIQEGIIADDYELAMKAFASDRLDDAFKRFSDLSENPLLVEQQVEAFQNFDWAQAKKEFVSKKMSRVKQYFFAVHKNLAKFVKDPTIHYLHALSARPTDKSLWYEFGLESAKRLNISVAKFAFNQSEEEPDLKTWEVLLRACFVAHKYEDCLFYLSRILRQKPDHLLARIIKSEIKKINDCWSRIIDGLLPDPGLGLGPTKQNSISQKQYDKVNLEADQVQFKVLSELREMADNAKKYETIPDPGPISVSIRLDPSIKFDELAVILCDLFDRIEALSSFSQQKVHFLKERIKKNKGRSTATPTMSQSAIPPSRTHTVLSIAIPELDTEAPAQPVSLKNLRLAKASMEFESEVFETMEELIDVWSIVEGLVENTVDTMKNNRPNYKKKASKVPEKDNDKEKKKQQKNNQRRSMRQLDSVLESLVNQVNYDKPLQKRDFKMGDFMRLKKSDNDFRMQTHEFRLSFPTKKQPPNKISPNLPNPIGNPVELFENENQCAGISVESFVESLLDNPEHGFTIEELLFAFCKHVIAEFSENRRLNEEQKLLFRQVYTRWANAFCSPSSLQYVDVQKMAIHMFTAELNSPCAMNVCMQSFGRLDAFDRMIKQILSKQIEAPIRRPSTLDEEIEKAKLLLKNNPTEIDHEEEGEPDTFDEECILDKIKEPRSLPSDFELMKELVQRIQEERKSSHDL